MAYRYDDFLSEARKQGLLGEFSQADLALAKQNPDAGMSLVTGKLKYKNAFTDDMRILANLENENIRRSYGNYTGGTDGMGFTMQERSPQSFYDKGYENPYKGRQENILTKLEDSKFAWDPETDENVAAYQKMYAREGDRASRDAMGKAAVMTGGLPSTAAVTAGAQAGQYYAAQMADKIPELRQQAYNEYMQKANSDLAILEAMETLGGNEYNRYSNDRNFGYQQLMDDLSFDANEKAQKQSSLEARAKTMAALGDFSLYEQMGYTREEIARLKEAWLAENPTAGASRFSYTPNGNPTETPAAPPAPAGAGTQAMGVVKQNYNAGITRQQQLEDLKELLDSGQIDQKTYSTYVDAVLRFGRRS